MNAISDYVLGFYDGPHATPKEVDHGPVFLGIKNVTPDGRLDFSDIRHVSEQEFPRWTKRVKPQLGDVVFSYEATLHRYALIPEGFEGCLGRRMALIRPDPDKLDARFLHFYLLSPGWRKQVDANVITGATVNRIPLTKVPSFTVEFPALAKQKEISAILAAYDDLIENNRRRIALLEESARQLYKEWFVRFRFPGHEHVKIVDGVPEGWSRHKITDVWEIAYGKNLPTNKITDIGRYPVHGADSIIGFHSDKNVDQRLCLITSRGAGSGNVRRTFGPTFVTNNCLTVKPKIKRDVIKFHFTIHAMNELRIQDLRTGAAQPQITIAGIGHVLSLVPSDTALQSYNDEVDSIFDLADLLRTQNDRLGRARDLLLPKLMSGAIAV